jgi:hypothetical protein
MRILPVEKFCFFLWFLNFIIIVIADHNLRFQLDHSKFFSYQQLTDRQPFFGYQKDKK